MPLSKSAKYYRSHPEARRKKAALDKKINKRPEQRKKRSELVQKNRDYDKAHGKNSRKGKDFDHGSGRYINSNRNRGKTSGTPGDKRARGKNKGK